MNEKEKSPNPGRLKMPNNPAEIAAALDPSDTFVRSMIALPIVLTDMIDILNNIEMDLHALAVCERRRAIADHTISPDELDEIEGDAEDADSPESPESLSDK